VTFAEPDYTGQLFSTIPNDPKFLDGTLWALNTNSAPQAWDVLSSASNIVVAVLDTGVRYTHEDLAANMWTNPNDGGHGWNAINGNNDPSDFGTHGTMVTGVLGAVGNNGKGVTGVAWRLQIMAGACFNSFGLGNVSDVVTCLDYARTNGARIINASWGFTNSLALSNAMVSLRDAGIIVVAACGNSTTNIDLYPTYPASYALDNIVSVASTSKADVLSSFSNFGFTSVDLAAPGEQIYTTFPATDSFYFNDIAGGTSFSAPYVAGACALLMAQYPADSYQQIISRLLSATDPLPSLAGKCRTGGRLNLSKVLRTIRVASVAVTNGSPFQLRVNGGLNRTCVVEATTNLMNWSPIFTNSTSADGTFDFTDSQSANLSQRFFRATASP
jgi:subtilisin family serine protease